MSNLKPLRETRLDELVDPMSGDRVVLQADNKTTEVHGPAIRTLAELGPRYGSHNTSIVGRELSEDLQALETIGIISTRKVNQGYVISKGPKYETALVAGTKVPPPIWKFFGESEFRPLEE